MKKFILGSIVAFTIVTSLLGKITADEREEYRQLAEQGDSGAQELHAWALKNGWGGAKNLEAAQKYFRRSAEQGDAFPQLNYALMLKNGEGGKVDLEAAKEYFRLSAEQGNACAQSEYDKILKKGE